MTSFAKSWSNIQGIMAREGENQPGGRRGILSESEIIYLK